MRASKSYRVVMGEQLVHSSWQAHGELFVGKHVVSVRRICDVDNDSRVVVSCHCGGVLLIVVSGDGFTHCCSGGLHGERRPRRRRACVYLADVRLGEGRAFCLWILPLGRRVFGC